jgi:hypothetical protein
MKLASLAICLIAAAGSAHASDGPFSHTSDGVTPAYIQYDASGAIVDLQCVPGSVCATRTASAPLTANGTQFSAFDFRPEPPFVDHYAFGVRSQQCGLCKLSGDFRLTESDAVRLPPASSGKVYLLSFWHDS